MLLRIDPRYLAFTALKVSSDVIDDIYIDLDGVAADFDGAMTKANQTADQFKLTTGSYLWLDPVEGAIEAINAIRVAFPDRQWFLTKPPKFSPYAYVEKALWTQHRFGNEGLHSLIVAQNKSLIGTERSILIDDRPHKGGVDKFRGHVIYFGEPINSTRIRGNMSAAPNWPSTMDVLTKLIKSRTNG